MSYDPSTVAYNPSISNVFLLSVYIWSKKGVYALILNFFREVTLSSLTTLGIQFIERERHRPSKLFDFSGKRDRDEFQHFIDRSGSTLMTLSLALEEVPLTEADVMHILKLTPSVHTLTLYKLWASAPEDYDKEPPITLHKNVGGTPQRFETPTFAPNAFSAQILLLVKLRSLKLAVQSQFDADQAFLNG
ncbi:hypothetical protein V5O48_013730 [Marasmius crinis-equi]|uniref:Uncharacterized protein n=1 Tax=Marasmius crinis-equi TaxID=585013 RepID=A0ABR3EZA4_9AGAR